MSCLFSFWVDLCFFITYNSHNEYTNLRKGNKMSDKFEVAKNLREVLNSMGFKPRDLIKALDNINVKIVNTTLSNYLSLTEMNVRTPKLPVILNLAKALNVPTDDICGKAFKEHNAKFNTSSIDTANPSENQTSEKPIFFTNKVQLKADQISKVLMHEGVITTDKVSILPHIFINDTYVFEGNEGFMAIEQLKEVGFYNVVQYNQAIEYFTELMRPITSALK